MIQGLKPYYIMNYADADKFVDAAIKFLNSRPSSNFSTENHSFFLIDSHNLIIKKYDFDELTRALNSLAMGFFAFKIPVMKSYGIIQSNDAFFLVSEFISNDGAKDTFQRLLENLKSLMIFHNFFKNKKDSDLDSDLNSIGAKMKFSLPVINYSEEFIERAIRTRIDDDNNRFEFLGESFCNLILKEYGLLFDSNLPASNFVHGDCRDANIINKTFVDFDHIRRAQYLEYDYARLVLHSIAEEINLEKILLELSDLINVKIFWANYFHHAVTLAAHSYAKNDWLYFNIYIDKALMATKELNNINLERAILKLVLLKR